MRNGLFKQKTCEVLETSQVFFYMAADPGEQVFQNIQNMLEEDNL
jgi:hypothetical protein